MLIDCEMRDIHMRFQASMLVAEVSKDKDKEEEEDLV